MIRFPIQGGLTIHWNEAQIAYSTYSRLFGTDQSLERLAERGGFGLYEFVLLYLGRSPGRDKAPTQDEIVGVLYISGVVSTHP